jgi:signal transduction histidine kinase/phage shock protein PspC (stress-responsive transcriptional regulator)
MAAPAEERDHRGIEDRADCPFPRRPRVRTVIRRRRDGRMLGGIATGISSRTGIDVTLVRLGLVLFGVLSGVGIAAYVVAWLILPLDDDPDVIGTRALADGRGLTLVLAFVPLLVGALLLASAVHSGWLRSFIPPVFVAAAGLVLIWRNGSEDERAVITAAAAPLAQFGTGSLRSWKVLAGRLAVGAALAVGGTLDLTIDHPGNLLRPLGGVGLVIAAFAVVFGPWWLSLARELVVERQARLRAEERAEMAARVHDSVLQTLAMIQRSADNPQKVAQLARAQERELRSWLFKGEVPGPFGEEHRTVARAVRGIQEEVEAAHGIRVETVVVGDCALTDDLDALLAAGREATVNAAKWSGVDVVSLFAEVEADKVSLFVRDRGKGFDLAAVGADRKGIKESVKGRVARHGGSAMLRSTPGSGTEVELKMPRRATGHDQRTRRPEDGVERAAPR